MGHSLTKNWLHIIFATKNRTPLITADVEHTIYSLIQKEVQEMRCYLDRINGMPDHIHLLLLLNASKSLADAVKQIKGGSAYQINQNNFTKEKFGWQTGYAAFSVSESQLSKIQKYIDNQKQHHQAMNFENEYDGLLHLHGLHKNSNQ